MQVLDGDGLILWMPNYTILGFFLVLAVIVGGCVFSYCSVDNSLQICSRSEVHLSSSKSDVLIVCVYSSPGALAYSSWHHMDHMDFIYLRRRSRKNSWYAHICTMICIDLQLAILQLGYRTARAWRKPWNSWYNPHFCPVTINGFVILGLKGRATFPAIFRRNHCIRTHPEMIYWLSIHVVSTCIKVDDSDWGRLGWEGGCFEWCLG